MEFRYKGATYKILQPIENKVVIYRENKRAEIHRLHPDVQDAFNNLTWDIEKLAQLLNGFPFQDKKLPKTPKGFELLHTRYWLETYTALNAFSGAPICTSCHRLPIWQRSWDETNRPYTITEFICFCGMTWQREKIND